MYPVGTPLTIFAETLKHTFKIPSDGFEVKLIDINRQAELTSEKSLREDQPLKLLTSVLPHSTSSSRTLHSTDTQSTQEMPTTLELLDKSFDEDTFLSKLNEWVIQNRFKVRFSEDKKTLKKKYKRSFVCSVIKCKYKLIFSSSSPKQGYRLVEKFTRKYMLHNHALELEVRSEFTKEIDQELDLIKGHVKTYRSIVEIINSKFGTSFSQAQIVYRLQKICEETRGKAHEDAYNFVKLAEEDVKDNNGFFSYEMSENNQFDKCVYLSNTMLTYSDYILDVVIVDATYRRNRFNLALVNLLGINNYGHSIILAFGLLSAETKENYLWLFSQVKRTSKRKLPKACISDDDEAIQQAVEYYCVGGTFKKILSLSSLASQITILSFMQKSYHFPLSLMKINLIK